MVDAVQEWVIYEPPKSVSFGHTSVPRDPRRAWDKIQKFLNNRAECELGKRCELTCQGVAESSGGTANCRSSAVKIAQAKRLFGPAIEPGCDHYPRWNINEAQLEAAIQFTLDDKKFPDCLEMPPSRLYFGYQFLWPEFERYANPTTENERRRRYSTLGVIIEMRRLFLLPLFVFPLPWNSAMLEGLLAEIEPQLPFRFREQYFKRYLPPKKEGGGRFLALPKGWRQQAMPAPGSR